MVGKSRVLLAALCCLLLGGSAAAVVYFLLYFPLAQLQSAGISRASDENRPNILFIVIDDMGFNDLAANGGSQVRTPNLDQLAADGVRFTRNYVNSSCTVSRVGIMTGIDPPALGYRPDGLGVSPEVTTLPESLSAAGYSTYHIGKWHMGHLSRLSWPTEQGYDHFYGFLSQNILKGRKGGRGFFKPLVDASELAPQRTMTFASLLRSYLLEPPGNGGWRFVRPTYRDPWLQYDAETPVVQRGHLSEILTTHAEQFIRERRPDDKPWFLSVWTFAPHEPVDPIEEFARRYPDTPAGKYLAFIEQVDASVGRILNALEENDLVDNTLVVVVSDNGGTASAVPSNYPFRGGKATYLEGGVRTPLILRWPGQVDEGVVVDTPVSYLEYFPTLAAVAGAEVPAAVAGRNLLDVIRGERGTMPDNLYWESGTEYQHSWSVLSADGRWNLSQYYIGEPELYDLESDPAQEKDLLAERPLIAQSLRQDYLRWRKESRRVPLRLKPLSDRGHAQLTGSALQRVPGHTGHTFAIAVTPDNSSLVPLAAPEQLQQTIVYQRNQWQLALRDGRLVLEIGDISLDAPAPEAGHCTSLVVTSYFDPGQLNPHNKSSLVELYVDGKLAASHSSDQFPLPVDDYLRPTYVGQDDLGERVFQGRLGVPVILNEFLLGDEEAAAKIENGVAEIDGSLCATVSG